MRYLALGLTALVLFVAGCTTPGVIPPQDPRVWGPDPRDIYLDQMASKLGWTYERGPGPYDYTMTSTKGDKVKFTIGSDMLVINSTRWRQERDAVELNGTQLLLPESTYNFICKHFGLHHMAVTPDRTTKPEYKLTPIPKGESKVEAPKQPMSTALKGLTICIDAGHGGKDPGGMANGVVEKEIALSVSLMVRDLLESHSAKVVMTRTGDTYPELEDRCVLANNSKCDLFVSIHANIAPNDDGVTGFEVFYKEGNEQGASFAGALVRAMDKATDAPNRGAKKDPRGLRVLEKTKMPATLVELGFMSNAAEAKRLTDKAYQAKLAEAVVEGIKAHWQAKGSVVSR